MHKRQVGWWRGERTGLEIKRLGFNPAEDWRCDPPMPQFPHLRMRKKAGLIMDSWIIVCTSQGTIISLRRFYLIHFVLERLVLGQRPE